MTGPALIALDWGTTSLRAYLLDVDGDVLARRDSRHGILNVPGGDFAAVFRETVGDWRDADPGLPALACGMIGSRQGWAEASYVPCPADAAGLAAGLLTVEAGEGDGLGIVPGVVYFDAAGVPDVMRGEETQIIGSLGDGSGVVVLPGTHGKWARVEAGRITAFATFMTGEAFALFAEGGILARTIGADDGTDPEAFRWGVRAGGDPGGALHALFGVRALHLFDRLSRDAGRSYLSGVLIGAEVEGAVRLGFASPDETPTVIGSDALTARYLEAFAARGIDGRAGPPDAAARGLLHLARSAGLIGDPP